jgi:WD40 repeat protein
MPASCRHDFNSILGLSKQIKLAVARATAVRPCIAMGVEAIAWSDAIVGVRVKSVSQQSLSQEMTLRCTEPSCIDVLSIAEGQHLLAVGTSGGRVIVWELDLRMQEWSQRKLLDLKAHDGPVTCVVFQHATKLASGSSDRSIALSTWDETGEGLSMVERRLLLKLRCKGMRIEGLHTETERAQFAKLIEESSAKTTQ